MTDTIVSKSGLGSSISELESLGLETPQLNELNDSYEVENLVENLKQRLFRTINQCLYSQIEKQVLKLCNFKNFPEIFSPH